MGVRMKIISIFISFLFLSFSLNAETIKYWTTEEQPARMMKQVQMAVDFNKASGHNVTVIPISESEMGKRAVAGFAADDLPDVIYTTLQYILPWAEEGIIDVDATNEVVNMLGASTFGEKALGMASYDSKFAGVPVDGWTQMVVYRKDLFEEKGLAAPNTFDNILKAIDALHNPPNMYGFVAATKTDENFMSQVLEHVLLANGCSPVDSAGIAEMGSACVEAIDFYEELAKASPPGDLFWQQSRELYFAGKAAMIIWSPFIMDELAGLRDSAPPTINDDPTSPELASKTGFITNFAGPSNPSGAAWADVRFMIITDSANTEVAQEWIKYAVGDGYVQTLSIAPEGKFPVRRGDASDSDKFVQAWSSLPVGVDRKAPLKDLYDASVINDIVAGLDVAERWGVKEGQLSAASKVINSQIINREVREVIDGNKSASDAVAAINSQISDID